MGIRRSNYFLPFVVLLFLFLCSQTSADDIKQRLLDSLVEKKTPESRQQAVKQAFLHAWNGYVNYAWGQDELRPLTKQTYNWMNLGLTIVDSLDTLYIMDLKTSFDKAKEWVAAHLNFNGHASLSLFETTIRVLGGLLSAHELSGEYLFLKKAKELGDLMLPAFETRTGIPNPAFSFSKQQPMSTGLTYLAEAGTLQMEFVTLSKLTGDPIYAKKALQVIDQIEKANPHPEGLYPVHLGTESGTINGHVTLGGTGDSFYEYLLKMDLLLDKKVKRFGRMYEKSVKAFKSSGMLTRKNGLLYLGNYIGGSISNVMEHLACFAGGMFALGGDIPTGEQLANTCYQMYKQTPSGIAAEAISFDESGMHQSGAAFYLLRPETVETLFVMYRLTKNETYRDMAWDIFMALEKHCRVDNGYSGLRRVDVPNPPHDNLQQSFFLAETLKYLYLIFSPHDLIPLDKYVFNTEAHPLKIYKEPFYIWENILADFSKD